MWCPEHGVRADKSGHWSLPWEVASRVYAFITTMKKSSAAKKISNGSRRGTKKVLKTEWKQHTEKHTPFSLHANALLPTGNRVSCNICIEPKNINVEIGLDDGLDPSVSDLIIDFSLKGDPSEALKKITDKYFDAEAVTSFLTAFSNTLRGATSARQTPIPAEEPKVEPPQAKPDIPCGC